MISIGTATDAGAEILCTGNKAVFKMHGKVVMSGKRSGQDIHHLIIGFDNNNGLTFATAGKKKISFSIIHQKFSHLNCRSIKRMAEKKAVERQIWKILNQLFTHVIVTFLGKFAALLFKKDALEPHDQIKKSTQMSADY